MSSLDLITFARELEAARVTRKAVAPLSERGLSSIADAYAIQSLARSERLAAGERRVGWKIGLTSEAVQRQLGVDQPDFGAVFASMCLDASAGPAIVTHADFIAPRFEAELAFRLSRRVTADDLAPDRILTALGEVAVAIEIVDSRVRDWRITLTDTVADNASHGAAILGRFAPLPMPFEPASIAVEMAAGPSAPLRGDATAVRAPGEAPGPVGTVLWLARTLIALGEELAEGDVVLSGAITPLLTRGGPGRVRAAATGLGSIELEVR